MDDPDAPNDPELLEVKSDASSADLEAHLPEAEIVREDPAETEPPIQFANDLPPEPEAVAVKVETIDAGGVKVRVQSLVRFLGDGPRPTYRPWWEWVRTKLFRLRPLWAPITWRELAAGQGIEEAKEAFRAGLEKK